MQISQAQGELSHLKGHLQTMKPTHMEASVFLLRNGLEFYLSYLVQLADYRSYTKKQFMQSTCENDSAIHTVCLVLQFWWTVTPERWQPPKNSFLGGRWSSQFQISTAETYALGIKVVRVPLFALNFTCFLVVSLF